MPHARFDKPSAPPSVECIIGGPACGKTTALLERARACAESGEGSIVYVCASKAAAERARRAISLWRCGGIEVKTGLELACEVLSDERYAARGLRNRLIGRAEERVLMEDVKVCGIKRRRLRELVAFLECGWSNLADEDSAWLKTNEEELVAGLVRGNLEFTGGVLSCEASALALRAVQDDAALRASHARDHVFVDDYERLGRATQFLVNELAAASIAVAAGDVSPVAGDDPYPWAEGVRELLAARPSAGVERLSSCYRPSSVVLLLNALRADDSLGAAELSVASSGRDVSRDRDALCAREASCSCSSSAALPLDAPSDDELTGAAEPPAVSRARDGSLDCLSSAALLPDASRADGDFAGVFGPVMAGGIVQEFFDIAKRIKQAIDQGVSPNRIFIAGTNRMWRANVARYLQQAGIVAKELTGDVRPGASAMRVLVGEGDPLCRSVQIARLREIAQPQGLRLEEALSALAAGTLEGADANDPLLDGLLDAYWIACGKRAEHAERLMVKSAKVPVLEGMEDPMAKDVEAPVCEGTGESASEGARGFVAKDTCEVNAVSSEGGICGNARGDINGDTRGDDYDDLRAAAHGDAVMVGVPLDAVDREFDLVIFGGFVNGFIPSADYCDPATMVGAARERAHAADIQALYRAVASARRGIVFTGFSESSLEAAERLKLHIARIKLKRGVRMCAIEPSSYASFVGYARP